MGFERGLVLDYATGWDMDDEEQMEEVERRVRDEEPVLLIAFSSVDRADGHGQIEQGPVQEPRGAMRKTLKMLLQRVRDAAECRKIVHT